MIHSGFHFFNQIKDTVPGHSLRRTFATIIENRSITDAQGIWDHFEENFTHDCTRRITNNNCLKPPADWSQI